MDQITRVLRMLLEWAVGEGAIDAIPFPKAALPERRRKATPPAPTAAD